MPEAKTKSKVYFIPVDNSTKQEEAVLRLEVLLKKSGFLDLIASGDKVAVKLHFGEQGNTGYVRPEYLRVICDQVKDRNALVFLADTNTLYRGKRTNSKDHLKLAYSHGFIPDKVNAEVLIPDDTRKEQVQDVVIDQKFIKTAKIARIFWDADVIIGVAHFKGHIMTGFGGALKNLGMGCATREGKLAQHSDVSPFVIASNCVGCKACEKACPAQAVVIKNKKSIINSAKCIGCASCIAACKYNAIEINWEAGGRDIQQKMIEHAKAVLENKKDKEVFINFCLKITQECDCLAQDDPRIAPDVGILVSTDPVSIDKASFDLVNAAAGKDVFKQAHPNRDGMIQLNYARELGLGSLDYDLILLTP
ncbi:MAG: DUF362 domain-containing protein [Candidatus Omnitrophica bacterium]|nr:DUF362 domain-containing protein [Candidatus Omnitrophota bacterium]MDD5079938.1 DUF362 domain-containing protein [Candidatus Omnitrophota bacterium]